MPRKPFTAPYKRVFDPDKNDPMKGLKNALKVAFDYERREKAGESHDTSKQSS